MARQTHDPDPSGVTYPYNYNENKEFTLWKMVFSEWPSSEAVLQPFSH